MIDEYNYDPTRAAQQVSGYGHVVPAGDPPAHQGRGGGSIFGTTIVPAGNKNVMVLGADMSREKVTIVNDSHMLTPIEPGSGAGRASNWPLVLLSLDSTLNIDTERAQVPLYPLPTGVIPLLPGQSVTIRTADPIYACVLSVSEAGTQVRAFPYVAGDALLSWIVNGDLADGGAELGDQLIGENKSTIGGGNSVTGIWAVPPDAGALSVTALGTVTATLTGGTTGKVYINAVPMVNGDTIRVDVPCAVEGRMILTTDFVALAAAAFLTANRRLSTPAKAKSPVASGPYFPLPDLADGVALATGAVANTMGAWAQVSAAAPSALYVVGIELKFGNVNFPQTYLEVEIGTGLVATPPVAVGRWKFATNNIAAAPTTTGPGFSVVLPFPIPIGNGVPIAARAADDRAVSFNPTISLNCIAQASLT